MKLDRNSKDCVPFFLNLFFKVDPNPKEYLLSKIGVDTAETEPLEVWGKSIQYYSFVSLFAMLDPSCEQIGVRCIWGGQASLKRVVETRKHFLEHS